MLTANQYSHRHHSRRTIRLRRHHPRELADLDDVPERPHDRLQLQLRLRHPGSNANAALDQAIGRLDAIKDSTGTLEQYSYLGLGQIVTMNHPQTGVNLTLLQQPGDSNTLSGTTTGGDQYTGLDMFGRVIDQNWVNTSGTSIDRYQYQYQFAA